MRGRATRGWEQAPPTGEPHRTGQSPTRVAGTCALEMAGITALAVVALIVTMIVSADDGAMPASALPAVLSAAVVAVGAIVLAVRRWGAAMTEELLAGYTTSTLTAGAWWLSRRHPDRPVGWVSWGYAGIEVRRRDGAVRQPATPSVPAPGFYPSPHESGRLELWTGTQWTRHFLDERWC